VVTLEATPECVANAASATRRPAPTWQDTSPARGSSAARSEGPTLTPSATPEFATDRLGIDESAEAIVRAYRREAVLVRR